MNQLIKPEIINFSDIVKNSNTTQSLNIQSKIISILNVEFTEQNQRRYVANLWMYMNYHATNDFPVNLEDVFHDIGFANKGNAKRTLENNFTVNEDYKTTFLHSEKGQIPREKIMLNIDTFKNLCMIAKTPQGKEMRKYYIKLENITNKIIKEDNENTQKLLTEKDKQLEDKDLQNKRNVESTLKNSFDKRQVVYLIKILIDTETIYKFGHTDDISTRLRTHKCQIAEDIELVYCIESKNKKLLERLLIDYLEQYKFRIKRSINNKLQTELLKVNDIEMVKNKLIDLNNDIKNDELLIIELEHKNIELEHKNIELEHKIIELKNEIIELKQQLSKDDTETIKDLKNKIDILEKNISEYTLGDRIIPVFENKDIVLDRIHKKQQVDKIDPTTLQILETYDCINAVIIKNPDHTYNQIYRSIKSDNVYKDYRWNYHGEEINLTNKITAVGSKVERIIKLDKNKIVVAVYSTKSELCKLLHTGIRRLNKYIEQKKIFDDFYYVNESSYDGEIPDDIDKCEIHNSKQIIETNMDTNEVIIYKTMKALYDKRGITRSALRECIKNNRICDKYKWEYVNNDHNKNNSKKVKELNIKTNTFIIYDSLKNAHTKLDITVHKLRTIINNKSILNDCIYEFC